MVLSRTWHCCTVSIWGGGGLWPAEERPAHLVHITTTAAFYVAFYQWIYLTYADLLVGLEVHLQTLQPPKALPLLHKLKGRFKKKKKKKSECCALFLFFRALTCTPTSTVTASPQRPWHGNIAYCQIWTGAERKTVSQRMYINYKAKLWCHVNLSGALKARTSGFNLGGKKKNKKKL